MAEEEARGKRLFVAVDLDEVVRAEVDAAARRVRQALGPAIANGVRWVGVPQLHLTVKFIGQVDAERVDAIVEAVARPYDLAPFELSLKGCGVFPRTGPPRVVWLGVMDRDAALQPLVESVESRLEPLGVERERRPFSAHLTLGRVREDLGRGGREMRGVLERLDIGTSAFAVSRVTCYESRLGRQGPTYEPLAYGPLAGDAHAS